MSYYPSSFQPVDIVETTEAYRTWAEKYYVSFGRRTITYSKGLIKSIHVLHHKDTGLPLMDYIILDTGFGAKAEHFQTVSYKCPDCKEETEKITVEGKVFFSCNNIFCGNIKLYDVFTLHARSPIIQKVE